MDGPSQIVKILFLAANPSGTERRRLDEEIRRIELALERAKRREQFKIIQKWAVTDDDLRRSMLDHEPEYVHFSGHGGGSQGLAFVDNFGRLQVISGESLGRLFELFADHVRCVILNACFSEVQAKVISRHIEIVVGMSQDIGDEASIKFSEGFYDALGAGRSAEKAFEFGRNAIDLRSLQEHLVPVILRNPEIRRLTRASASGNGPKRIVPRGLRSFQPEDSDFFLELLPGPRGPDGLPTSLRFWKTRIEERNPDRTFPVGLIYGPSGCGKSSLVKAGLLPRLSDTIQPVFVEATADDTETRLLKGLRGVCPGLKDDLNPIDTFITLRKETQATGRKTLIVIDQFEQWLHAKTDEERTDLALALRLCDGANVQCILMIRDDFWLGTNRLMKDIGVHISEGENAALVDLFDVRHARKVLGLFADAYGVWEDSPVEPTERAQFLDDAVSGLAQGDRVICVRIALFCELFQGKPWDLKTLEKSGGVEGVGVLFMEETFSADDAPAENRYHQKAVRSVLNALLPEPGSKIKGRMRPDRDLIDVSGYADRPDDFQALIRILDEKTHLITPTDPEGQEAEEGGMKEPSVVRFYQLTHDYLVPSIREWLTRKQKETRRGRAELRLADRSAIWAAKPENRQLPSVWEWANIRLLTQSKDWTEPQQRMMKAAGRLHSLRALGLVVLVALGTWAGVEGYGNLRAAALVESLTTAGTADVPPIIDQISGYRRWADPLLSRIQKKSDKASKTYLNASLALLPIDDLQVDFLYNRMLAASPSELQILRDALEPHRSHLTPKLWEVVESARPNGSQLLPAASALALYEPASSRWADVDDKVAQALSSVNSVDLGPWLEALLPIRSKLTYPLTTIFRDVERPESERTQATSILADYASDEPVILTGLLLDSEEKQFTVLFEKLKVHQKRAAILLSAKLTESSTEATDAEKDLKARRQARAAVAVLRLNHPEIVLPILRHSLDPTLRSQIVNLLKPLGADPNALVSMLGSLDRDTSQVLSGGQPAMDLLFHPETSERRALILALGEYEAEKVSLPDRKRIFEIYMNDPDPGVHGAAEWTLRQWKVSEVDDPKEVLKKTEKNRGDRRWYLNSHGQTMVVIEGPSEYRMGSPADEPNRYRDAEVQHLVKIDHRFAMGAKEVSVEDYKRFVKESGKKESYHTEEASPDPHGPRVTLSWYEAAEYCNWLSEREKIDENQWAYATIKSHEFKDGMRVACDDLSRTGYRLPTEEEWEFACRSGAITTWYHGYSEELLPKYAWYQKNAGAYALRSGRLKPNDFGLFDMLGNAMEWCQNGYYGNEVVEPDEPVENVTEEIIFDNFPRYQRGGGYFFQTTLVRCAARNMTKPFDTGDVYGFRVVRTLH